jgi:hypothetical protein
MKLFKNSKDKSLLQTYLRTSIGMLLNKHPSSTLFPGIPPNTSPKRSSFHSKQGFEIE